MSRKSWRAEQIARAIRALPPLASDQVSDEQREALAEHAREIVATWPPLPESARAELRALLRAPDRRR